mmetsp:Transcript_4552/g.10690  ORF Transcript_4552/g.10690 Transcript_4552/m.10690 type:complete len:269 (+) Transcript_4552:24-830(+)
MLRLASRALLVAAAATATAYCSGDIQGQKDRDGWESRWAASQIGWHRSAVNPGLVRHFESLCPSRACTVLVPLCGKSQDLLWLSSSEAGENSVIGFELVKQALDQLHSENNLKAAVDRVGSATRFRAQGRDLTTYACDFLALAPDTSIQGDAAFDRGSLVALPLEARGAYVDKLLSLMHDGGRVLLLAVEYDVPGVSPGPPHSVSESDVARLFASRGCQYEVLHRREDSDPSPKLLKAGAKVVYEVAYLITKTNSVCSNPGSQDNSAA